ncbi:DivIVA domain-containing protein [Micromonospora sp. SL1-18]|uniref:DivIVA domain-containing protein n=1 Tax=Micromonospora sp. SL1-18 TaxID=3399128 RepID=UPI003A4E23A9
MELRRSRSPLIGGTAFLAFGVVMLLCSRTDSALRAVFFGFGAFGLLRGGVLAFNGVRPFRFHIGAEGLTVRQPGLNRLVPWAEIDALILDQPLPSPAGNKVPSAVLLLVPASGSTLDRPLTQRSPVDDRPCFVLLGLNDVGESPNEVAAALARYGDSRFTDFRELTRQRFDSPDFTIGLRGYDPARVDRLIRQGQEALASDVKEKRLGAKAEIEQARKSLPAAMRGYNTAQVDAFLDDLSAALARWDDEKQDAG